MSALPREAPGSIAHVPIGKVVERVCREMSALAGEVDRLQVALAPIFIASGTPAPETLRDMQAFDALAQKLRGLSDFLAALVPAMPDQWNVDSAAASRAVLLADLADRLSGAVLNHAPRTDMGDLEWL